MCSFFLMFMFNLCQARHEREIEEAEREEERVNRAAQELDEQIQADAIRQLMAKEQQYKARKRANSEATELPFMGEAISALDVQSNAMDWLVSSRITIVWYKSWFPEEVRNVCT